MGAQALLGTTCLRFCHEWTNYHWFNTCITRKGLWVVHIVTACAIAPMALMIDTGQDEGSGSKIRVGEPHGSLWPVKPNFIKSTM